MKRITIFLLMVLGNCMVPGNALVLAASAAGALADYSSAATSLFNNMRSPAAFIGGALVPLGIASAPTINDDDSRAMKLLKRANIAVAVASVLSEIMAVIYSSIAINKIAEISQPQTRGVAELIAQKHELAWLGTNIHFLFGMMGFALIAGSKSFFLAGPELGKVTTSWSIAAFLQALAVVNRGIAQGSAGKDVSSQFGSNFFMLIVRYIVVAIKASKGGFCGPAAIAVTAFAMYQTARMMFVDLLNKEGKKSPASP
eukprot:scaffold4095_cov117-Cylindrotheca_fusiformis.AAC.25